jgi:hypothetical protein
MYSLGRGTADDLGLELIAFTRLVRLDLQLDPCELAGTARLLPMGVFHHGVPGDAFTERHLRGPDPRIDVVGTPEDIELLFEVEFACTTQDDLAGLEINKESERRIFGNELYESGAELLMVGLRFRFDRDLDQPWLRGQIGHAVNMRMESAKFQPSDGPGESPLFAAHGGKAG